MADKTKAEVRLSGFQYKGIYSKPIIARWAKSYELAQALFEALSEWNVSLDNITSNQFPNNFGQIELSVQQFLQGRYSLRVGLDAASLSVWNPDWTELPTLKRVASAAIQAIRETLHVDLASQDAVLDIHLAPQGRTRLELTSRFLPSDLKSVSHDLEGYGFLLHRKNRLWHIDLSAQFPDALYVRLVRTFDAATSLDGIASAVQQEETDLLNYLGLSIPGFP